MRCYIIKLIDITLKVWAEARRGITRDSGDAEIAWNGHLINCDLKGKHFTVAKWSRTFAYKAGSI